MQASFADDSLVLLPETAEDRDILEQVKARMRGVYPASLYCETHSDEFIFGITDRRADGMVTVSHAGDPPIMTVNLFKFTGPHDES